MRGSGHLNSGGGCWKAAASTWLPVCVGPLRLEGQSHRPPGHYLGHTGLRADWPAPAYPRVKGLYLSNAKLKKKRNSEIVLSVA